MTLALIAWAVIHFSVDHVLANINVGILYIFAVSSLGVYGIIISLKIYFKASASDCNRPNGPTTLGPCLFCTNAQILLSNQTINATETKTGTNKNKIL